MLHTSYPSIKPIFIILKYTYTIVPIISGIDKFTNILTQWEKYLPQSIISILPFELNLFMMIIGSIEIIGGIIVLFKPVLGGYIGAILLALIAISIATTGNYLDTALRNLVMAIGAFALARIGKLV